MTLDVGLHDTGPDTSPRMNCVAATVEIIVYIFTHDVPLADHKSAYVTHRRCLYIYSALAHVGSYRCKPFTVIALKILFFFDVINPPCSSHSNGLSTERQSHIAG